MGISSKRMAFREKAVREEHSHSKRKLQKNVIMIFL